MEPKNYPFIHSMNQKIAASRPGAWLYARTLPSFDRAFMALSGGRMSMTGLLAGLPVVWVTAIGAKSGRTRTVPILCIPHDSDSSAFGLIASNFGQRNHPAWYYNLKANPRATCRLKGHTGEYMAREAGGEEYERIWERGASIYLGYPLYKERVGQRTIPILVLSPVSK